MKLRDCMIFGNSLQPFSKIDWENDQGPKGSCQPLKAGVSSARRSCRPWSSKLQKVLFCNPVTHSSLDRFTCREFTTWSKWLQNWIDTTYLGAFDQTFFLNRVYWDSFTRSDLDAQLAPIVGKKWCTPGDHCEGADGVHQNGRYKVPKRMPRSRSICFIDMFFHGFGAKMSLCRKAACIYVMFSLRKASHCWSSAFLINPPDIRQKKSRYDLVWYIEGNHSEDKWHPGPRRWALQSLILEGNGGW